MGLHLEIDGGASLREWTAAGVIALIMVGQGDAAAELARTINLKPAGATEAGAASAPVPMMPPLPTAAPVIPTNPADAAEALMALAERTRVVPSGTDVVGGEPLPPGSAELPVVPVDRSEVDGAGLPWDIRIHAGGKTKNKDGTWRGKRGVDPALVATVEAELKAIMGAPAVTVADVAAGAVPPPPPPPVPEGSTDGPVMVDPAAAFGGNATAPAVPAPPATPAAGAATAPDTNGPAATPGASPSSASPAADMGEFARVMRVVTAKQKAGMGTEITTTIAQQLGLTSVRDLVKRPDLIPAFEAMLP